jgi:Uncharacterised nucleotidyltransferase
VGYAAGVSDHPFAAIERTFKRSVDALRAAEVPFLLGGALASWARGGPETRNDLDLMVKPDDAERALQALVDVGMRPERPPEGWLLKAWDDDVLVDLIFHPKGMEITDEVIARGDDMDVLSTGVRVMALEDVLVSKLLALTDHNLDMEPVLQVARALREQIDWDALHARTASSAYAKGFLVMCEELGVAPGAATEPPAGSSRARVRVVS